MSFKASDADAGLYIALHNNSKIYILDCVDDILIAAKGKAAIINIKERLTCTFDNKKQILPGGNSLGKTICYHCICFATFEELPSDETCLWQCPAGCQYALTRLKQNGASCSLLLRVSVPLLRM